MDDNEEIDILGDFDYKSSVPAGEEDTDLPSHNIPLLPEFSQPPWFLDQDWSLVGDADEKSRIALEKMLSEEREYAEEKSKKATCKDNLEQIPKKKMKTVEAIPKKRSPWNEAEKAMFYRAVEIYGRRWSKIAHLIPSKTRQQIKNFALHHLERKFAPTALADSNKDAIEDLFPQKIELPEVSKPKSRGPGRPRTISTKKTDDTVTSYTALSKPLVANGEVVRIRRSDDSESEDADIDVEDDSGDDGFPNKLTSAQSLALNERMKGSGEDGDEDRIMSIPRNMSSDIKFDPDDDNEMIKPEPPGGDEYIRTEPDSKDIKNEPDDSDEFIKLEPHDTNENNQTKLDVCDESMGSNTDDESPVTSLEVQSTNSAQSCGKAGVTMGRLSRSKTWMDSNKDRMSKDSMPSSSGDADQEGLCDDESSDSNDIASDRENFEGTGISNEDDRETSENDTTLSSEHVNELGFETATGDFVYFAIPSSAMEMDREKITDDEKLIHWDYFESDKLTERYMRIRNHILDQWMKLRPSYMNKTTARAGLRNCGDVNRIGRVHSYLEQIGAINFGCEHVQYSSGVYRSLARIKHHAKYEHGQQGKMSNRLDTMGPRRRRVKNAFGDWIDERYLKGETVENKDTGGSKEKKTPKPKPQTSSSDPFQLIPCANFNDDHPAPFSVDMHTTAMLVMDIHAHLSKAEVIGLLGGRYYREEGKLVIEAAEPCDSLSTGMQCEMDPVSQTEASERIHAVGQEVVGWYHSHPMFAANPSVRDMETQLGFQDWFAVGGGAFLGVIVSPYNHHAPSLCSDVRCLVVKRDSTVQHSGRPYQFDYTVVNDGMQRVSAVIKETEALMKKYAKYPNRVQLLLPFHSLIDVSALDKMMCSLSKHVKNSQYEDANKDILDHIRLIFEQSHVWDDK